MRPIASRWPAPHPRGALHRRLASVSAALAGLARDRLAKFLPVERDAGPAEDAVQEAVLIAWLNLGKLRRADQFGTWLAGIA